MLVAGSGLPASVAVATCQSAVAPVSNRPRNTASKTYPTLMMKMMMMIMTVMMVMAIPDSMVVFS